MRPRVVGTVQGDRGEASRVGISVGLHAETPHGNFHAYVHRDGTWRVIVKGSEIARGGMGETPND